MEHFKRELIENLTNCTNRRIKATRTGLLPAITDNKPFLVA